MNNQMGKKFAVVGLGALFPDARNITDFWQNIISKKVSIKPLPDDLLNSEVFYRPDLLTAFYKEDKTTTKVAAWIDDLSFNTVRKYRIPPSVAEHMDSNQHAALYTVDQALEMNPLTKVATDRIAVIFGNGMVGTRYGDALNRVQFQRLEYYARKHKTFQKLSSSEQKEFFQFVGNNFLKGTIPITEDSAPGILPNLIAGRIANVFDFHGPSFTVDAACASVLAAVIRGIQGLQLNEYDAVLCGGSDMPLKDLGFVLFSALNALSPDGSYPFDKRANGFVMGQGAGALTLKRLEDAIANQDTIYAVITGYGEASDGKGKYIAAPNAEWQARTIEKACQMAGYPVDTIELIEAHGTATRVGDVEEVNGLKKAFSALGATRNGHCGLTSVKSNIGHLKSAAGIAGLIKAVLAIHNKMLPPTASFEEINPKLELQNTPFYILDELREWQSTEAFPRRANVSSFGFGGADYHITLEEYREQDYSQSHYTGFSTEKANLLPQSQPDYVLQAASTQLVFFAGESNADLDAQVSAFKANLQEHLEMDFADICLFHNYNVNVQKNNRLAILATSPADLASKHAYFQEQRDKIASDLLNLKGIYYQRGQAVSANEIAILFPGQASQYPGMFNVIRDSYDTVRTWFQRGDAYWFQNHHHTVSSLIYASNMSADVAAENLKQTQNAHPAIFLTSFAFYQLLNQMGLKASYMIGHSLGEITALAAAGKILPEQAFKLVDERGYAFFNENLVDPGKMISIRASQPEAQSLVDESKLEVWVANLNSPRQTIIAGASTTIDQFKAFVDSKGIKNQLLQVSHAFHTSLMKPVAERFYKRIEDIPFKTSEIQVMMNHQMIYYPNSRQSVRKIPELLKDQILQPVRFMEGIRKLHEDGVRLFIEVGPGSILSNLVKEILANEEVQVLTSNFKNADECVSLQKLCGELFVAGVPIQYLPTRRVVQSKPAAEVGLSPANQPEPLKQIPEVSLPQRQHPDQVGKIAIIYSGAAIGLPGSYKESFRDDNFTQIFEGRNFIERLTDQERQWLVDLQISKLIKDESGPTFKLLTSLEDVIQLAGKAGKIDMIRNYHIDEKIVRNMTSCIALGVAAGYEALRDAQIPLVREYLETTTGSFLPQKLALPKYMQDETGVIFANGFPLIDPVIEEVSRYISYHYGSKTRSELMSFYESIIQKIKDPQAKKLLSDWYTLYYSRLTDHPGEDDIYQFNHHFMTQISAQANNLLAMLINARGPNFQINAACSSTSNAITIAEDFIRSGRVKRMIIVGADDPTSKTNLPYLGAGFLCTGAATNEADLYKAALPFDNRRNGMLMGAGAVGIVLETQDEVEKRGVSGICELLGTHSFNTAKHISQIDAETFSNEFDKFISRMEQAYGLQRDQIARNTLYISHEPFTPPRGGCSHTEAQALRTAFSKNFQEIIVGNSKGMTGHTMGASLEDALIAKALQYGKCPPVVNLSEPDAELEGLNFWKGGTHNCEFALKLSAGFGSQGHFAMIKKISSGDHRIANPEKNKSWLESISPGSGGALEYQGRILCLHDPRKSGTATKISSAAVHKPEISLPEIQQAKKPEASQKAKIDAMVLDKSQVEARILSLISQMTGYPPEMLEPDMELGSDLGLDSAKQEAISSKLVEDFNLASDTLKFSGETTLRGIVEQVTGGFVGGVEGEGGNEPGSMETGLKKDILREGIIAEVLKVFSEVTKYPEEMLELDMEMEADLGIDTVKKATILAILGERYRMEQQEGLKLSDYPTIRHIVDLIQKQSTVSESVTAPEEVVASEQEQSIKQSGVLRGNKSQSNLSRQVVLLSDEELGANEFDLRGKSVCILGDEENIVNSVASVFREMSVDASTFVFPQPDSKQPATAAITEFANRSSFDVIIDCTHIGKGIEFNRLTLQETKALLSLNSEARFLFYKSLSTHEKKPARIVCLTSIDGFLGLDNHQLQVNDPTYGALLGFYKALRKEWIESEVRIIDFSEQAIAGDFNTCMDHVLSEIQHSGKGIEICYIDGIRKVAKIADKELHDSQKLSFSEDDTFLITGGGTGLGARIALAIAETYQAKIIIVDLLPLPENIETLAQLDEKGLEKLKKDIHDRLKQTHERVTPVMLNQEIDAITRAIEIHKNLINLQELNSKVVYIPCDVRNHEKLGPLLRQAINKLGMVTAIIHAAGVDRSHLIDQKSEQEFHDVFSVKAQGANNLYNLCRDNSLRLVVTFGSISGRFGNAAQLDYSAANSYLSYWIRMIKSERPNVHTLSLVWSGWKDIGMAWRNELVRQRSEEIGLNLIEIDQGIAAFLQEIEHKTDDVEVILHRGLDGFLEKGLSELNLTEFPLIDRITKKDKQIHRAYRLFSIRRDALIDQHRLGNTPIMPAVGYVELAVEFYALQAGKRERYLLRDLFFSNPFKLFRESPRELFIEGVMQADSDSLAVEIKSSFRAPKAVVDQIIVHASMLVSDEQPDLQDFDPQRWDYHNARVSSLPAQESVLLLKGSGDEQRIILGPLYNDNIRETKIKEPALIYPKGTTYPTYFPLEQLTNAKYPLDQMKVNPCFLDSLLQACAANLLVNTHRIYLPWKIGELAIVDVPRTHGLYRSHAQIIYETADIVSFNIVMVNGDGKIHYYARDAQFRLINL
jgi:acyl transferase domain-containing protein/NAD(P)-dependent dehydrogenase (short-subunit alcohol dehydrogenase family)/acyl carrier protein